MRQITYIPVGIIHSRFKDVKGMPIQTVGAKGVGGTVEIEPKYEEGLKDLEEAKVCKTRVPANSNLPVHSIISKRLLKS
jgi:tRNA (Thr-GGU) A37 N-methylase